MIKFALHLSGPPKRSRFRWWGVHSLIRITPPFDTTSGEIPNCMFRKFNHGIYNWEVFKIGQYTSLCKSEHLAFKKLVRLIYWEYDRCEYTILELKYHIFRENYNFGRKVFFDHFLGHESQKSRIFKDFQGFRENHDFSAKSMVLRLNRGRKINFLVKLFFKLFSFLDNLKNGFFKTFLKPRRNTIPSFCQQHCTGSWNQCFPPKIITIFVNF